MSVFLPADLVIRLRPWRLSAPTAACHGWRRRLGRHLRSISLRISPAARAL